LKSIKARHLIPLLVKWTDLAQEEGGNSDTFRTLEQHGVEDYFVPKDQLWKYKGELIEEVSVQGSPNGIDFDLWFGNGYGHSWRFPLDSEISLTDLTRYTAIPLPFEVPTNTDGQRVLRKLAKQQAILAVTTCPEHIEMLSAAINEDDLNDCIPQELAEIMYDTTQRWCDKFSDSIIQWLHAYNVITNVRIKYGLYS